MMKTVDALHRARQVLRFLFATSAVLFWCELLLLVGSLVLMPVLYVFWNRQSYSLAHDGNEMAGLIVGVVIFYILKSILGNSISIVDNALSGKIFSRNNSDIVWIIFRKIFCFSGIVFFAGVFSSFLDPAAYGPFSWIELLSDLADSALCLGLLYLIALLFEMGVQLQSEMDEVI